MNPAFSQKSSYGLDYDIWPADLVAAQTAFGQVARLRIIRHLRLHGPSTRSEIVDGTLISAGVVGQCINKLKSLGLVVDSAASKHRPARDRTYALDGDRTDHLLQTMTSFITGDGCRTSAASSVPVANAC